MLTTEQIENNLVLMSNTIEKYLRNSILFLIFVLLFNSSDALTFHIKNKLYFGQSRLTLELNSTEVEPIYIMEYYKNLSLENLTTVFEGITYTEEWKDIKGFEDLYRVSNFGRIKALNYRRTKKEVILKLYNDGKHYYKVSLCKNGKSKKRKVHQLVAEYFLNHKPCGYKLVVNHINLNKNDNRVENLEVITNRENCNKKHLKSSSSYIGVYWHKVAKKWCAQIQINGKIKYLGLFKNEIDASISYENELNKSLNT